MQPGFIVMVIGTCTATACGLVLAETGRLRYLWGALGGVALCVLGALMIVSN